jgi:hypothetical protein
VHDRKVGIGLGNIGAEWAALSSSSDLLIAPAKAIAAAINGTGPHISLAADSSFQFSPQIPLTLEADITYARLSKERKNAALGRKLDGKALTVQPFTGQDAMRRHAPADARRKV